MLPWHKLALAEVTRQVCVVQLTSTEAAAGWSKPIVLLFIDGDHSYEGVRRGQGALPS
jgi:hypothetical protein